MRMLGMRAGRSGRALAIGAVLSLPLLMMAPSFACSYSPTWTRPPSPPPVATGAPFEFVGRGFIANETVFFALGPEKLPLGEALANVDGTVITRLVIPDVPTGSYVLRASQVSQVTSLGDTIRVVRTVPADPGDGGAGEGDVLSGGPTTTIALGTPPPPPPGNPVTPDPKSLPSPADGRSTTPGPRIDRPSQALPAVAASGPAAPLYEPKPAPGAEPAAAVTATVTPLPPMSDDLWSAVDSSAAPTVLDPPSDPGDGSGLIGLGLIGAGGALVAATAWIFGRRRPVLARTFKR